ISTEVAKLDIRWNAEQCRYTFKDGTSLPDPVQKLYRRNIWPIEGLNGEAEVLVVRENEQSVLVTLSWEGKAHAQMPRVKMEMFAPRNRSVALEKSIGMCSPLCGTDDQPRVDTSHTVELAEGEAMQVQLEFGQAKKLSPVYKP